MCLRNSKILVEDDTAWDDTEFYYKPEYCSWGETANTPQAIGSYPCAALSDDL